jgi:hypothetical protein
MAWLKPWAEKGTAEAVATPAYGMAEAVAPLAHGIVEAVGGKRDG